MVGLPGFTAYAGSKFAVRGFAEALQMEVRPFGVRVCVVNPPDVDTPMYQAEMKIKPEGCCYCCCCCLLLSTGVFTSVSSGFVFASVCFLTELTLLDFLVLLSLSTHDLSVVCACVCVCVSVCVGVFIYLCVYRCVCIGVCISVSLYSPLSC
jgi:short chain dehydrogenase